MVNVIIDEITPITLVGGASFKEHLLKMALNRAPKSVGADGGGAALIAHGQSPLAIIGDMDSVKLQLIGDFPRRFFHFIAEQKSTDFEKCLQRVEASAIIGVGFLGSRVDHQMAVQSVLVRYAHKRCLLLGEEDIVFVIPPEFSLVIEPGVRVSIFPMAQGQIESQGLYWPTTGLIFAPNGQIGTSNRSMGNIRLVPDGPNMIGILPIGYFEHVLDALLAAPKWPSRGVQASA